MIPADPKPRIQILPPAVAERIAAGEVIERPSSVVKELVENSIDAGATEVVVCLEDGGKSLIEVLDNGSGMPPEDLALCIERHATSKLGALDDLEKIRTLGFRGEALPSVAAVADLSILSRAEGYDTAYEISLTRIGEKPKPEPRTFGHFLASPHGTRIQARGLFSQVPARLKFLKSAATEVSQVREWIERLALAHPEVGFKLVSEDRIVLALRPQDAAARVRKLLGDEEDFPHLQREAEAPEIGLKARVHWLQGLSSPQTRKLVQVVNGRAVRDRLLQQAILAAFRQALLPGQFPAVALFLEIDPAQLDVNVHPTKTEIRFLDARRVFRRVETLIEELIGTHGAPAFAAAPETRSFAPPSNPELPVWSFQEQTYNRESAPAGQAPTRWSLPPTTPATPSAQSAPDATPAAPLTHPLSGAPYTGTLFQTYLLYDLGQELALVDQHAAHERIRYEKLKKAVFRPGGESPPSQQLLLPEALRFERENRARMESRLPWLFRLGFEAELFGEDTLLFRAIPSGWGTENLRARLQNLTERALELDEATPDRLALDEHLFEKLASEACHSSVRAGDRLEREEAESLVNQLFRCEHPWNCPHGRPTVARVPRARFEEWFQRRVP